MDEMILDTALPAAPDCCGVMRLSASDDPVILSGNDAAVALLGRDPSAAKLVDLAHPDDLYELRAQLGCALAGRRCAFECRLARLDGGYVSICGALEPGLTLICTFIDVTELRRRDADERAALRERRRYIESQNELLSRCLYNLPCAVLRYAPDGRVLFVNRCMLELLRADCDSAFAQRFWSDAFSIVPFDQRAQLRDAARMVAQTREPRTVEHDFMSADGARGRVRETMLCIEDIDRTPALMSVCIAVEPCSSEAGEVLSNLSRAMLAAYESVYLFDFDGSEPYYMALVDRLEPGEVNRRHALAHDNCAWLERHIPRDAAQRMSWLLEPDSLRLMCAEAGGRLTRHFARERDGETSWHKLIVLPCGGDRFMYFDMDATAQGPRASGDAGAPDDPERYRTIVEHAGCAVFEWNCMTGEVYRSPDCARYALCSLKPEQILNSQFEGALLRRDMPALEALCAQVRSGAEHAVAVVRLAAAGGGYPWTRIALDCRRGADGALLGVIGSLSNIDAVMRTHVELESAHDRLEQTIANLPVGICIIDITDRPRLEYVSPRALAIMGFAPDEGQRLFAQWLSSAYGPDNRRALMELLSGLGSGRVHEHTVQFNRDGAVRQLRLTCSPMLLENGWRCYTLIADVTEVERNRAQLERRQELFALLCAHSNAVLCDYDVAADRMTLYGLASGCQVYENYMHNIDSFVMIGEDTARAYMNSFQEAVSAPGAIELEFRADFFGDGYRWYGGTLTSLADTQGRVNRVIGRFDDTTQAHARVAGLRATAAREAAYRRALTAGACAAAEYNLATGRPLDWDPSIGLEALRDLALGDAFELCAGAVHPDERDLLIEKYLALRKFAPLCADGGAPEAFDCRMRSLSGRYEGYRWLRISHVCARDAATGDTNALIYAHDIDSAKHAQLRLDELRRDPVTGLPRRDEFERSCGRSAGAFALIALNGMSEVNRRHGRQFGDGVLRSVADTLRAIAGRDELLGRMGGAEFGLYTAHAEPDLLRERMRALCAALRREPGGDTLLSACAGVALASPAGEDFQTLVNRAHAALNHARNQNGESFAIFGADTPVPADAPESDPGSMRAGQSVFMRTFGYFDVFIGGRALLFNVPKTKELLALLVDRHGGYIEPSAAIACLWEDEPANKTTLARYRKLAMRLRNTLAEYGIEDIVEARNGRRRIRPELIQCDLYNYLSGSEDYLDQFAGMYMQNYSWAEPTLARLVALRRARINERGIVDAECDDEFE